MSHTSEEMRCPKCKSLDVVDTMYCNFSTNPEHSETQGYMCDECDHEWSVKDKR